MSQLDLVGHAPVESSRLLKQFLKADLGNSIYVEIIEKRKREVGLVMLAKFSAPIKCSQCQQNYLPAQNIIERQKLMMIGNFPIQPFLFMFRFQS